MYTDSVIKKKENQFTLFFILLCSKECIKTVSPDSNITTKAPTIKRNQFLALPYLKFAICILVILRTFTTSEKNVG